MSGVVLRCPHCGTTQAEPGQCEACHESAVRYFCRNHEPGAWLAGATCPQCGARFGDPAPVRKELVAEPREARSTVTRTPPYRPEERGEPGPWAGAGPAGHGGGRSAAPDPFRILVGAMAAAARARAGRVEGSAYDDVGPARRRGGGCIGRIFMLVLFLLALFLMAPLFLGALFGLR